MNPIQRLGALPPPTETNEQMGIRVDAQQHVSRPWLARRRRRTCFGHVLILLVLRFARCCLHVASGGSGRWGERNAAVGREHGQVLPFRCWRHWPSALGHGERTATRRRSRVHIRRHPLKVGVLRFLEGHAAVGSKCLRRIVDKRDRRRGWWRWSIGTGRRSRNGQRLSSRNKRGLGQLIGCNVHFGKLRRGFDDASRRAAL